MSESTHADFLIFFGCWKRPGHFHHDARTGRALRESEIEQRFKVPGAELDGSRLFLPHPEVVQHGALTYLPAPDRTILAWWNRVFDQRGAVNSALIAPGRRSHTEMWDAFTKDAPEIAAEHTMPLIAKGDLPANGESMTVRLLMAELQRQRPDRAALMKIGDEMPFAISSVVDDADGVLVCAASPS